MTVRTADDVFLAERGALFGLAYRMLGTVADAEDAVSEAYLRWQGAKERGDDTTSRAEHDIRDPHAYLMSVVARISIDVLRSARRRRVDYVGPWLPEPLLTDWTDPVDVAADRDTLSLGLLMLLEQLTPAERAVFVLREAFGYPHEEIAAMLGSTAANTRQHLARARRRLSDADPNVPRFVADRALRERLLERFIAATTTGEVEPLAELLTADAVLYADGGGKASAIRQPAHGALRIARFFRGLIRASPPNLSVDPVWANGAPALLVHVGAEVIGVYAFDVDATSGLIRGVYAVRNPDKLTRTRSHDHAALLACAR